MPRILSVVVIATYNASAHWWDFEILINGECQGDIGIGFWCERVALEEGIKEAGRLYGWLLS